MAGTIISTPNLGDSDWSTWVTQQERTDRGFMRLSLTNYAASAASSIATGSVLECAGSIYQFTETAMTLATGTASASVSVYFHVIPSAGGTSCTIEMDSTAPTWVDAKQGFYASAASLSRVIGGCYIGTAATYYNKYFYEGDALAYCARTGETRPILFITLDIGEWNMDATGAVAVPHNIGDPNNKVVAISAVIKSDPGAAGNCSLVNIHAEGTTSGNDGGRVGISTTAATSVFLSRQTNGYFDSADFDGTASTISNRGYIFIEYEA